MLGSSDLLLLSFTVDLVDISEHVIDEVEGEFVAVASAEVMCHVVGPRWNPVLVAQILFSITSISASCRRSVDRALVRRLAALFRLCLGLAVVSETSATSSS